MNPTSKQNSKIDILIVDDNPDNLRLLSSILSEEGYKIRRVISGEMALQAVIANSFDLICLDINIPDMSGYEICRKLKSDPQTSKVPIIFISALDEAIDKVKAFEVGGVDYISKPFKQKEVIARVKNQIKILSLQQELESLNNNLELEVSKRTEDLRQTNTELKQTQQKLLNKSLINPVTNLDNKISLMGKLHNLVRQVKINPKNHFALIVFNCHSYPSSDIVLNLELDNIIASTIANRLSNYNTKSSFVAYIEQKEFVVVINRVNNPHKLKLIAENLQKKLTVPLHFVERIVLKLDYGIALGNESTLDAEALLKEARIAARKSVKFDRILSQGQSRELDSDNIIAFEKAFSKRQLSLLYRPIVALKNSQVQQVEIYLSQSILNKNVIVSQDLLASIYAKESLGNSVLTWIMETAITDLKKWRERIIWDEKLQDINENIQLIFKLTYQQLLIPNLITRLIKIFRHLEIPSEIVAIELSEYFIAQHPDLFEQACQQNQDLDLNWYLDNFSFKYLALNNKYDFKCANCKISSKVVDFENLSSADNQIAVKMLKLIKDKEMSVTVTDIQTLAQLKYWEKLGCKFGSGKLIGDLISGDGIEDLLIGVM